MVGVHPFLMEHFARPVYDLIHGASNFQVSRFLGRSQWISRDEIEHAQARDLKRLLRHAYETVPYYHRVFRRSSLSPDDINSLNDLSKLPVLNKEIIRKNF